MHLARFLIPTTTVLCALGLAVPTLSAAPQQRGDVDPLVIAVEAPLTGPESANGRDMLRGVKLAITQINASGGLLGRKVTMIRIDDQADPSLAASSVQKAISAGAFAVVGPYNSSVGVLNLNLYQDAGIVPLRMTSADTTQGYGATTQPMVKQTSPVEVPYLASIAETSVVMLVDPSTYTRSVAHRTARGLRNQGLTVSKIFIDPDASDYADVVAEALSTNPDVIYSSTYYPAGAQIARDLMNARSTAECFMNLANVDNEFVEIAGIEAARQCTFSGIPAAGQLPSAQTYVTDYVQAFGVQPDVWGSFTYDSALVIADAVKRAGTTAYDPLLEAVLSTRNLNGATGTISINSATGNRRNAPMYILEVDAAGTFVIHTQ